MSSAICFNLDQFKILSSGNEIIIPFEGMEITVKMTMADCSVQELESAGKITFTLSFCRVCLQWARQVVVKKTVRCLCLHASVCQNCLNHNFHNNCG